MGRTPDDIPPEWKLDYAIRNANEILLPALGDLPSDPRVRDIVVNLSEAIRELAVAHIERLRGEPGWRERAKAAWSTAASVQRLVVMNHDTAPFDALGSIELSVESVADALLNTSGVQQEDKRRGAMELAKLAKQRLEGASNPYLKLVAGSAHNLAEGSLATQAPPQDGYEGLRGADQMPTVDPDELPYPPQPFMITPQGAIPLPSEAIDCGSGQCRDLALREAEGVLCFYRDQVGFHPDRGGYYAWPYEQIESYSIKGGWVSLFGMQNLSLRTQGRQFRFRIGPMLAANADYILRTIGARPR